jgi:hypothetical protein
MLKKPKQVPKEPKVAANVSPHYSGLAYHISDLSLAPGTYYCLFSMARGLLQSA